MIHSLPDVAAVTGTKVALNSNGAFLQCNWFQVQVVSASADARIGDTSITSTRGALIGLNSTAQFCPPAGNTDCYDLGQIFILGTTGDSYAVIYNR